jgi:hypothetical protein
MKKHILCVVLLGLLAMLAGNAWAHNINATAPRVLAYVPDEYLPTVDGNLQASEYDWVPPAFVYRLSDYLTAEPNAGPRVIVGDASAPYSASDFDVPFAFLGWNPTINSIIIVVQTVDDVGYTIHPYFETWRTIDSIYWYMDANHNGGQFQYYDPARTGADGQQGIFRPDPDRGGRSDLPAFGQYGIGERGAWAFREPYAQTGLRYDPANGSYALESTMQVWDWMDEGGPAASVLHQLKAGDMIGMRFNIVDQDSENENDFIQFSWNSVNPGLDNAFTSDGFDDFILLSKEQTLGAATVAESQTWGRVKAAFK